MLLTYNYNGYFLQLYSVIIFSQWLHHDVASVSVSMCVELLAFCVWLSNSLRTTCAEKPSDEYSEVYRTLLDKKAQLTLR